MAPKQGTFLGSQAITNAVCGTRKVLKSRLRFAQRGGRAPIRAFEQRRGCSRGGCISISDKSVTKGSLSRDADG